MTKKTVYWSHLAGPFREGHMNLLNNKPRNLMVDLAKDRKNFEAAYTNCVALHEQLRNTYALDFSYDIDIKVHGEAQFEGDKADSISLRKDSFKNRHTVDIDMGWIFYSAEPLELEVLPPFSHQTEASKYGVIAHGKYDIGQWFRPIRATYILWKDIKEFKAKENDPIAYLRFDSEQTVVLKQFIMNPVLLSYAQACGDFSDMYSYKTSLKKRYAKFKASGMRNLILAEIEKTLVREFE